MPPEAAQAMLAALRPGRLLLGLDFDGTLARLASRPQFARLPAATRRALAALSRRPGVRLAFLSGRRVEDLMRKVGLKGVHYAGNHGLEIRDGASRWTHPGAAPLRRAFDEAAGSIAEALEDFPGAWLEHKGLGLAVHYREVGGSAAALRRRVARLARPHAARLRLAAGKKVWELRPRLDWDKGRALLRLRARLGGRWRLAFIGDDATDEEAFRTLGPSALTIRVGGSARSRARLRLRDTEAVARLLGALAAAPRAGSSRSRGR